MKSMWPSVLPGRLRSWEGGDAGRFVILAQATRSEDPSRPPPSDLAGLSPAAMRSGLAGPHVPGLLAAFLLGVALVLAAFRIALVGFLLAIDLLLARLVAGVLLRIPCALA